MSNKLWIALALTLALGPTSALVQAQGVPPEPIQPVPPTATPAPEQPTTTPAPEPTYVPPPPPQTTLSATPEELTYPTPVAPPARDAGPFAKGRLALSILVGSSFTGDRTYLMLGLDLGYYLIDGLEFGAGTTFWLFDEPFIATISPHVRYVFHMVKTVKPYVGAFYRHYFVAENVDDVDSLGLRAGAYIAPDAARWYFGLGIVYEHLLDCNSDYWSCDDVYPELSFTIAF